MSDLETNNSGSVEVTSSLNYSTKGSDRDFTVLFRRLEEMEREVHKLKTEKIINETQFSPEMLANSGLLPPPPKKTRRGKGYRQILQSEIEEAKKHGISAAAQARWMGIAISTYRKYCKMYDIWTPRPTEKGKRNFFDPNRGKFPLNRIITGEFNGNSSITNWMVIDKLIRGGIFPPRCSICGYDKRRITDRKICLLLDHKNGDSKNFTLENLQILCYNCMFECGRGYVRRGNHMFSFDPEMLDGCRTDELDKLSRW